MKEGRMEKAYVHVYTGDGKGKTTAALGLSLRALGAGLDVYIGQFIKGMRYSEIAALEALDGALGAGRLEVRQYGRGCFIGREPEASDFEAAQAGLAAARDAVMSEDWDLVILDELNVALSKGLVAESDVIDLLERRPASVELVLTGRGAPGAVLARADLVTEMRCARHYYEAGVQARDGIER
jgi:cob(I)alamin adenosyltransferase